MKVFVVILNYNGSEDVVECLESVLKAEKKDFELSIVVVDNHSTDNSLREIQNLKCKIKNCADEKIEHARQSRHNSKLKIIKNKKNLGFAGGNNVGIRWAKDHGADWVFLLNNDTKIAKDALIQLIKVGESDKKIGILGPKIYFYPGCEFHQKRYQEKERGKVIWYAGGVIDWQNVMGKHKGVDEVDIGQYNQAEETEFISGCALMAKREVFEKIGLLDERYFLYYEDVDFCLKAKKTGFKLIFAPNAIIWHKNKGTRRTGLSHQEYYMARNRLILGLRWASLRTKLALIKESIISLLKGSKWKKRGVVDFYLLRFGKGSY